MSGEHVLLVDDEIEFVEALSERLSLRGVRADSATSGDEALDKVRKQTFDVVILDLAMPGMDGIETLRAMKDVNAELQVVLLTGRGSLKTSVQAMKLGAMDFLEKPVKLDVLLEKIEAAKSKHDALEQERIDKLVEDILITKGW